jgi:uncharacterized lipoprotein YbaY
MRATPAICLGLLVLLPCPSGAQPDPAARAEQVVRGFVTMTGQDVTFQPCGAAGSAPVIVTDETRGDLARVYRAVAGQPGQAVFMEVTGPAADATGRLLVRKVRRAAAEGVDCDEAWGTVSFRARGNEPFWSIAIAEQRITLDRPGESPVHVGPVKVRMEGKLTIYQAMTRAHRIELRVEERRCIDGMSGQYYPFAVEALIDEEVFTGCGEERPAPAAAPPPGWQALGPRSGEITGTISSQERIDLPADAVVQVSLLDVSRNDGPPVTLAEQMVRSGGRQVPLSFSLPYDGRAIEPGRSYAIRARIEVDGALRFTSTRRYSVLGPRDPCRVDILVVPVP